MGKIIGLIFEQETSPKKADNPDVFKCPVCGKEYKTEEGLERHIQDKHPENKSPESGESQE